MQLARGWSAVQQQHGPNAPHQLASTSTSGRGLVLGCRTDVVLHASATAAPWLSPTQGYAAASSSSSSGRWQPAEHAALQNYVRQTESLEDLVEFFADRKYAIKASHVALICHHMSKILNLRSMTVREWGAAQAFLRELSAHVEPHMSQLTGQDCVYLMSTMAKLRHQPSIEWLSKFLMHSRSKLSSSGPGHLTGLLRALATLDLRPWDIRACPAFQHWFQAYLDHSRQRLHAFDAQELTRTAWALADLRYRPDPGWLNHYTEAAIACLGTFDTANLAKLINAFAHLDYQPSPTFLKAYYREVYYKLPLFDQRDLATCLSAFGTRHQLVKGTYMKEFLDEAMQKLPSFSVGALANMVLALTQLRHRPPEQWVSQMVHHVQPRLREFNVGQLCAVAYGLSRLGDPPPREFIDSFIKVSHAKLKQLQARDFLHALLALETWRYRPDEGVNFRKWFETFTYTLERQHFRPREVCVILKSFANLGWRPDELILTDLLDQLTFGGFNHVSPDATQELMTSLVRLNYHPGPSFLKIYCTASRFWWSSMSPAGYASMLRGFALFEYRDMEPALLRELLGCVLCKLDEFDASSTAGVLWGLAALDPSQPPSSRWLELFVGHARRVLGGATAAEAADMLCSLVALGAPVDEDWREGFQQTALRHAGRFSEAQAAAVAAAYQTLGTELPEGVWAALTVPRLHNGSSHGAAAATSKVLGSKRTRARALDR